MATLARKQDCLLLDLDGTLYRGRQTTEGAVRALEDASGRKVFVTNNAARSPEEGAAHLRELGFKAVADDLATSAQSAARLLANQLPSGSRVLVVGTQALVDEVTAVGLQPVARFSDGPDAVVQGLSFDTNWSDLAEATLAIRDGALWVAANLDRTIPTERGLVPCNGSMVAALKAATEAEPQLAGKPAPAMIAEAAARDDFCTPLMVGDRTDTDIAGANAAGVDSLMVLSGAHTVLDLIRAEQGHRPTYVGHDLRSLHLDEGVLAVGPQPAWDVDVDGTDVTVYTTGDRPDDDGLSVVRAIAAAAWEAELGADAFTIDAGDRTAAAALDGWSLLSDDARSVQVA